MSTTIGFGYSAANENEIYNHLNSIAEKFGYGLLDGLQYAETDIKSGVEIAQRNEGWKHVLFLQSPVQSEVALAFDIHEELTSFETTGVRPKFFDFLNELSQVGTDKCKKLGIFFAGEWYQDDRVRYSYGSIDCLITLLSMPGHWGIRYMIPQNGQLQDSDETPLIFDLILK